MTLREEIISSLVDKKIPSPRLETDIILKHAAPNYPEISKAEENLARTMLHRRLQNEPLDKIIGKKEFFKSVFEVNSDVLSPRPDTEILVEGALELIPEDKSLNVLDLGTGSGCILLSLLSERPQCVGIGIDASLKAIKTAMRNAKNLNLTARTSFVNKSWEEEGFVNETYDIIVSNPPYIPTEDIAELETEVKNYDPLTALDGGKDGLECYRQIAKITPLILKKSGYILLEVGYNQAKSVEEIFQNQGLKPVKMLKDLAGINRCVILKK